MAIDHGCGQAGRRFSRFGAVWIGVARGLALFIGGFSLLNLIGELRHPGFDANLWWIDLRMLGPGWSHGLLALAGLLLPVWAIWMPRGRASHVAAAVTLLLLAATMGNALAVRTLAHQGAIATACPISFSLLVLGALAWVFVAMQTGPRTKYPIRPTEVAVIGMTISACLAGFPLAQMWCFGMTDYRRPADAVVVFGARVYADGGLSLAVADRVRTACSLYREGLVRMVILSGGPGDGDVHETEGMRRMAVGLGVPDRDILLDEQGLNTEATVRNTCGILAERRLSRVLAVSHFYHLPRIKLAYQRHGREVYTVPAQETRRLRALPAYMLREIAAVLFYYVKPLA